VNWFHNSHHVSLVILNDFDIRGACVGPVETNTPLFINTNTPLTFSIANKIF